MDSVWRGVTFVTSTILATATLAAPAAQAQWARDVPPPHTRIIRYIDCVIAETLLGQAALEKCKY